MEFHSAKRLTEEGKPKVVLVDIDETICYYKDKIIEDMIYQFLFKKI
jgi:predicted secreted acid phosphatase